MPLCTISEFVKKLAAIPKAEFTQDGVYRFLKAHPIDPETLKPYLHFRTSHYTRNLIDKNKLYEVIAICWEKGQISQVHNHKGQHCWMAVPIGKLLVQNFRVVTGNPDGGHCELTESDKYWMDPANPGRVELDEPIHYVANPAELNQRACSIHIYSHPYDSCMVYSLERKQAMEIPLHYSSEYGVWKEKEVETV